MLDLISFHVATNGMIMGLNIPCSWPSGRCRTKEGNILTETNRCFYSHFIDISNTAYLAYYFLSHHLGNRCHNMKLSFEGGVRAIKKKGVINGWGCYDPWNKQNSQSQILVRIYIYNTCTNWEKIDRELSKSHISNSSQKLPLASFGDFHSLKYVLKQKKKIENHFI